jgi:RNA polymerase sigma-70 factor (ECF subfamily)
MTSPNTAQLQDCLDRLRLGDDSARQALLQHSQERLRLLTRKMLRKFPGVRRWEETDDVFQNVLVRLDRLLRETPVGTVLDYLRLASTHIRRELIDLARHHFGPRGGGANLATPPAGAGGPEGLLEKATRPEAANESGELAGWAELHQQIDRLAGPEKEVFGLLWYQGLTQEEAAALLGVSLSTVKRRWQAARLHLMEAFGDEFPF